LLAAPIEFLARQSDLAQAEAAKRFMTGGRCIGGVGDEKLEHCTGLMLGE
jgi:hypothetical protein